MYINQILTRYSLRYVSMYLHAGEKGHSNHISLSVSTLKKNSFTVSNLSQNPKSFTQEF